MNNQCRYKVVATHTGICNNCHTTQKIFKLKDILCDEKLCLCKHCIKGKNIVAYHPK